jgi:ankyrin repeat protein
MTAAWEKAVTEGDLESVRRQLDSGIDVDSRDKYGQTALMVAAHRGHIKVIKEVIAHGADLDVTAKYNLTAVMLAVIAGHSDVARILARAGADLSKEGTGAPGFAGKTAYDLAVSRRLTEVYEDLRPPDREDSSSDEK